MPKKASALTPLQVKKFSQPGLYAVGGVPGLQLRVYDNSRSWILRVMVGNRRRDIGLGAYPDVSLAEARELAKDARRKIRNGIDPVLERQELKQQLIAETLSRITFRQAATEYQKIKALSVKRQRDAKSWLASLERHAFPVIGNIPVMDLETSHIHRVQQIADAGDQV